MADCYMKVVLLDHIGGSSQGPEMEMNTEASHSYSICPQLYLLETQEPATFHLSLSTLDSIGAL